MEKKALGTRSIKPGGSGSQKGKANQPAGSFFPLGSRDTISVGSSVGSDTGQRTKMGMAGNGKRSVVDSPAQLSLVKRPRLDLAFAGASAVPQSSSASCLSSQNQSPAASSQSVLQFEPTNDSLWKDQTAGLTNFSPTDLLAKVRLAEEKLKTTRITKYLCAAIQLLYERRRLGGKMEPVLASGLAHLVRLNGAYFQQAVVAEALCALVKSVQSLTPVPSLTGPPLFSRSHRLPVDIPLLGVNLLYKAFEHVDDWPITIVKVFLDDSLSERIWVDRSDCRLFVANILTAFGTVVPVEQLNLMIDVIGPLAALPIAANISALMTTNKPSSATVEAVDTDDSNSQDSTLLIVSEGSNLNEGGEQRVRCRFEKSKKEEAIDWTLRLLRDWWTRRRETAPKSLLKTMAFCAGLSEVRIATAQKIDAWLQNTKLQKQGIELLLYVGANFNNAQTDSDIEILNALLRLKALKSKPVMAAFNLALKEILSSDKENMVAVLRLLLNNEFSAYRMPYNMAIMHQCFIYNNRRATEVMAMLFCELMRSTDDYLRHLRGFLREFVRSWLRAEFSFSLFGKSLVKAMGSFQGQFSCPRERAFDSMIDLLCMIGFLGITPAIRDNKKGMTETLSRFYCDLNELWLAEISWLGSLGAAGGWAPNKETYVHSFYYLAYLSTKYDFYSAQDSWPADIDRGNYLRIVGEGQLEERVIEAALSVGSQCRTPIIIDPTDIIDFIDQLSKRAALNASLPIWNSADRNAISPLRVSKTELVESLFALTAYKPPPNMLPPGFKLPMVAVSVLYWKSWTVLLIWSAHNPETIGKFAWDHMPTARYVMQMAMTNEYQFPAPTGSQMTLDDILKEVDREEQKEKAIVLELETHLAGQSMDEHNSRLLSLVCSLDPRGPVRKPSNGQLDELHRLNDWLKLGLLLCKCRQPDLLLQVIRLQGAGRSMPWLMGLIEANEGSLSVLPIQCLCEFLMHQLMLAKSSAGLISNGEDIIPQRIGILETVADHDKSSVFSVKKHSATAKGDGKRLQQQQQQQQHKNKLEKIDEMKSRLREAIWDPSMDIDSVSQVLVYFLTKLSARNRTEREAAFEAFDSLLTVNHSEKQIDQSAEIHFLRRLPKLPHFVELRPQLVEKLCDCCLVETDASRVFEYAYLVASNVECETREVLASKLAKLVVDRPRMIDLIVAAHTDGDDLLHLLLHLYDQYMERLIETGKGEAIAWSAKQDEVRVEWPSLKSSAVLPLSCLQAIILLLSRLKNGRHLQQVSPALNLLDLWFPIDVKNRPVGYLLDTMDEAELTPETLKPWMLRSCVDRLVNGALEGADPASLCTYAQTFGLPTNTAQIVLAKLDRLENVSDFLEDAKAAQPFVKAYRFRGALSGDTFLRNVDKELTRLAANSNVALKDEDTSDETILIVDAEPVPSIWQSVVPMASSVVPSSSAQSGLDDTSNNSKHEHNSAELFTPLLSPDTTRIAHQEDEQQQKTEDEEDESIVAPVESLASMPHTPDDKLMYRLVGQLFETAAKSSNPENLDTVTTIGAVLRRIAFEKPNLVLRHFSLFDSHLRETVNMTMRRFSDTNYRQVFDSLLKMLLSMRPAIYEQTLATPLENVLTSFFEFILRHALRNRTFVGIVSDVLDLTVDYVHLAPSNGRSFLESHAVLLQALSMRYPDIGQSGYLLREIGLCGENFDLETIAEASGMDAELIAKPVQVRPPSPLRPQQLSSILNRVAYADLDGEKADILLCDLEDLFLSSPTDSNGSVKEESLRLILGPVQTFCCQSENGRLRAAAFRLLLRMAKKQPQTAAEIASTINICLQHPNTDIVRDALEVLPSIAALCREDFLENAFRCALKTAIGPESTRILAETLMAARLNFDKTNSDF